jgi:uncharacterized protein (TIGR02231 family)
MAALLIALLAAAPVVRVVVYPDRAQVTRAQAGSCAAGTASIAFDGITPAADPASFRAASPDAQVLGVRVELVAHAEAFAPEAEKLNAQIRDLEDGVRAINDQRSRATSQESSSARFAEVAAQLVGREMMQGAPDAASWERAFDASLQARLSAVDSRHKSAGDERELARKLADLRARQAQLAQAQQRQSYRAEVVVGCGEEATARAELSYLVGGSWWEPAYEARVAEETASPATGRSRMAEASKDGSVELSMFATVRQATGEDWKRAQVILSTAIPRSDATPPEVSALRVGALERKAEKKVLVRRDVAQEHAEAGADNAPAEPGAPGLAVESQGLSVQLVVREPADVAGDGTPARLFVGAHKLAARFAYRTVPKLLPYVFRVADLVNTAPFPLLPGQLDVFGRSGFIARAPLERVAEGAKFHLAFGLEDRVEVKRLVLEELQRDTGLFGQNKRFRYAYRFELTSHLEKPESIELSDHLPLSELDDVKVELEDKTSAPREVGKDDGIVRFQVALQPGEKKSIDLAFHVDVPGSYESGGL